MYRPLARILLAPIKEEECYLPAQRFVASMNDHGAVIVARIEHEDDSAVILDEQYVFTHQEKDRLIRLVEVYIDSGLAEHWFRYN